ncbi:uncharacterized protein LOC112555968 [Pomacea canaliculata]|uniref:uncharacterized protein LOC112555968 n=1 Tax=Pomacea canaliculata TaxID=400727 RepID=UPI000D737EA7|nr:uncharacterized protein LOC112555968 [Pomacea canaliculata]
MPTRLHLISVLETQNYINKKQKETQRDTEKDTETEKEGLQGWWRCQDEMSDYCSCDPAPDSAIFTKEGTQPLVTCRVQRSLTAQTIQQRVTATRWEITSSPMKLRLQMVRRTTHGSQGSQLSCCSQQRVSRTGHRLMAVRLSSVKVFVKGTKFGPAGGIRPTHYFSQTICGYKTVINNTNNESLNDDNTVLSCKEHLLGFVTERTFPGYNCPL